MTFTLNFNNNHVTIARNVLETELSIMATSPKGDEKWTFAEQRAIPLQTMLNQLKPQVLSTNDSDLIHLFRRAVRNYSTIHEKAKADAVPVFNKHYQPPPFLIPKTDLKLDVRENDVIVTTLLSITRASNQTSLILDAEEQDVLEVCIDGTPLNKDQYKVTDHEIIILSVPLESSFEVKITSSIKPFTNSSGEGLYLCGDWLTTQCEAECARRIFPTLDRPDVLSRYTTTIEANGAKYPCRISNGNLVSETTYEDRTSTQWDDPFPKPSYLFAAVMGEFGIVKDTFTTRSGRKVLLEVYVEKGKEKRAEYALVALKKAMKFEEDHYDREYDLDCLKLVAMPNFNLGAMENKGLMIFNESCILVDPECASDIYYYWVASTICHEYCHNWSGNRVTVRNWFELALKEAFTDFRSSEFAVWLFGNELVRPMQTKAIRERQFPQDANPSAHPIQMDSYTVSSENYDNTIYVKGREVFRMLKILLDEARKNGFRIAQNAYFDQYDGQAVTFRELLHTLQQVSGIDLDQFERWFHQPGTPTCRAKLEYDHETETAKVHLSQTCPHPKTKEEQEPFHIPLYVELLDRHGNVVVPRHLVSIKERKQVLVFDRVYSVPIPVFQHDFCAPIRMEYSYSNEELETILLTEQDPFARKEAGEIYLRRILKAAYQQDSQEIPESLISFYRRSLTSPHIPATAKAELLSLPSIRSIIDGESPYDFVKAEKVRSTIASALAVRLESIFVDMLQHYQEAPNYNPESDEFKDEIATRKLRNSCYAFLSLVPNGKYNDMIFDAYEHAGNFNNQYALLELIVGLNDPRTEEVVKAFYEKWKHDGTILNNWISLMTESSNCTVAVLESIFNTEGFLKDNADHMRSLVSSFGRNLAVFHGRVDETYKYVIDRILQFSKINPSVAADLAEKAFSDYPHLPEMPKAVMNVQLLRLADPTVNDQLRSIANKILGT